MEVEVFRPPYDPRTHVGEISLKRLSPGVPKVGGEGTSAGTTFGETLHYIFDPPFPSKVDNQPFRDVAGFVVFLVLHVPFAIVLMTQH